MHDWDPTQYLKFSDHRLRPALDLMAQMPLQACAAIWDLGCGPGNITKMLAERWPQAEVSGFDSSPEMLAKARAIKGIAWMQGDIAQWQTPVPADLIFSNAALHWVPDHARLFPRLVAQLKPGGVLAVQMPRNHAAPSHTLLAETAKSGKWAARLAPHLESNQVAAPQDYYDWLTPLCAALDIWETVYLHALSGENPVVEWTRGSALKPFLDALAANERPDFLAEYGVRVAAAYPPRPDGKTLFPFRRLFLIARR
jgi:trans-aconitate 2-methyltransferase